MKRPLQLPLAIALALSATDAFALGLGTIHVNSKLNQPLDAEIPVLQGSAGEAEGLLVQLAGSEDFDRVGLSRSRLSVPLEFALVKGSHGDTVIKVTSKEVVKEPFLDFLVEANWPKGRLLREYTVLLDPPIMAPATGAAATSAVAKAPERAPTQTLPETKPKETPAARPKPAPVASAPRSEPTPSKPAPATAPRHAAASGNEYTVEAGDTLSGIAREARADDSTNLNQMMLALLKQNPNAFYKDNINALKRGAILRIPSADQVKAVGSASEAASTVHSQIEDWRGGAAAKPTLVADTGAKPAPKATSSKPSAPAAKSPTSTSTASTTAKTPSERLELVPPKAGKDSLAMSDRPGSGAGSAAGSSDLKADLARTKEALASRDQETGELKSRVKDLEDTKSKSDRLLSLKDSEIADLQHKLKDLESGKASAKPETTSSTAPGASATSTSPAPAPTTAGKTDKLSKEDIWGNAATTPGAKTGTASSTTPPATPSSTTPSFSTPTSSTASTTTPASTNTPSVTSAPGTATQTPGATSTTATTTTPSTSSTTAPSTSTTTPSTIPSSTTESAPSSTPPTASTSTTPTPVVTPAKPVVKPKMQPVTTTTPMWYEQSWVKPAAIGAAALLVLAGLLGMRKRKVVPVSERGSIAGAFGDSPLRDDGALGLAAPDSEEQALRDQLMDDPSNVGLHLELLSLFYSERNVAAFEDAAEAMHAHVTDPHQPEWLEAKAMGQELAPHNPLFADDGAHPFDDEAVTASHAMPAFDHDEVFNRRDSDDGAPLASTAFDFDLDDGVPPAASPAATQPSDAVFAFDNLPPMDFAKEAKHEAETAAAPPLHVDEDEFPGEDGVSTKLDLAKAYLDMGDPEGARSMLDEVLAEGNDTQKGEARRLMAEIR